MPDLPVLHVCSLDTAGGPIHPCAKADKALEEAGIEHTRNIFDRNHPMGLFTAGKRPELKAMSGQEKLPVLELPDGSTVNGSGDIVKWAKAHAKA
jgi:glutathione S-transferase